METLPLVQRLRASYRQRHEYAILATFNANLRFFEQRVLTPLRAQRVLCLMDAGQLELATRTNDIGQAPRHAGVKYQVEPVDLPRGVFHPKFILCLSPKRSRLVIGSGNLSRDGYLSNAEVFTIVECENDESDEAAVLIGEVCDFLEQLSQSNYTSPPAKETLERALQYRPRAALVAERHHYFLNSLDRPLLDAVAEHVGRTRVKEVHILSPFLGSDTRLCDRLAERFGNPALRIYVQQDQAQFNPDAMDVWFRSHPRAQVFAVEAREDKEQTREGELSRRYIHAKLLALITTNGAYLLSGSPNFTQAALLHSAREGNIETAILSRFSHSSDALDLLGESFLNVTRVTDWAQLRPDKAREWDSARSGSRLQLVSARYSERRLSAQIEYPRSLEQLEDHALVYQAAGGEPVSISATLTSTGGLAAQCELVTTATVVWVVARNRQSGERVASSRKWVRFPELPGATESVFTGDDFDRCIEIGGIEGAREALKLAASDDRPDWLISFLQSWDLTMILGADANEVDIGSRRRSLIGQGPRPPLIVKPQILKKGLEMLTQPDLETLLEELIANYRDQVAGWLAESEAEDVWRGLEYATVFNILCLLIIHSFQATIGQELAKKQRGLTFPDMQYGHVREMAKHFVEYYQLDWEKHFRLANVPLASLAEAEAAIGGKLALFHVAQMSLAYLLASKISERLDLERPVHWKPLLSASNGLLISSLCASSWKFLQSSGGQEVLSDIVAYFGVVTEATSASLSVADLHTELKHLLGRL